MNEQLFRGFAQQTPPSGETLCFNGKTFSGKWVEGCLINAIQGTFIAPYTDNYSDCSYDGVYLTVYVDEVIPETVGQFTGMTDKKSQRIWQHSECVVTSKTGCVWAKGYIKPIQGCFVFVEYGTRNILRLCDLNLNNYEIEVVNDFYNYDMAKAPVQTPLMCENMDEIIDTV